MDHPFERILLASEHTEFDVGAENVALALAQRCGVPLGAVLPVVSNPEYEAVAPLLSAKVDREAADKLAHLRALAAAAGVHLEARVRRGEEPWREIVDEARDVHADLLITRRRGKRGFLANLLVGDMVGKVAGHAPCSVLMVPRSGGLWRRRILAAVDGSGMTERVARVAAAIAVRCGLPLTIVTVADEDVPAARIRAEGVLSRALDAAGELKADFRVLAGKAFQQILAQAAREGADLICVGHRGETDLNRPLLGATAQKVIGLAEGPVMVVRG